MPMVGSFPKLKHVIAVILVTGLHLLFFQVIQDGLSHKIVLLLSEGIEAHIIPAQRHEDRPPLPETNMPIPSSLVEPPRFEVQKSAQASQAIIYEKPATLRPVISEPVALLNEVIVKPHPDPALPARSLEDYYPENALLYRVEGTAIVALYVIADGTIAQIMIEKSSGFPELDNSAIQYVSNLKFLPGTRNGVSESMWLRMTLTFSLKKSNS